MSHSPRKASRRSTVFSILGCLGVVGRESPSGGVGRSDENGCENVSEGAAADGMSVFIEGRSRGFVVECVEDARAGAGRGGSGIEARPALMPTEVCTHRRKGEECRTT